MVELEIARDGTKMWYRNGIRHRNNLPAIVWAFGRKDWIQNDEFHRLDGPAIVHHNGMKHWYYHNHYVNCNTQEEFERLIKLRLLW